MTNLMISSAAWAAVWALLPDQGDQGHGWWSPKVQSSGDAQSNGAHYLPSGASARLVSHWEANELRIVHVSVVLEYSTQIV
jgi:hypothetical protein